MAFKQYNYGAYAKEIKTLMRQRLCLKDKIRYHRHKADELESSIINLDSKIQELLKWAKGKSKV